MTRGHGDHDGEVLQPRAQPTHVQQVLVTGAAEHHLQGPEAGVGGALPGLLRPRVQDNPSQQVESSDFQSVDSLRQPPQQLSQVKTIKIYKNLKSGVIYVSSISLDHHVLRVRPWGLEVLQQQSLEAGHVPEKLGQFADV